ncbi:MAG: DNA repair protein RecO [Patescibacteria group bacterium]
MAHHVYTTLGFILDSQPSGEANRVYWVFTKDLGMVRATAQGVRLSKSKLKAALQDLSLARVSIVRGKDIWRITNAKAEENYYHTYLDKKNIILVFAHVFSLLKRFIPGEQKDEELFVMLQQSFEFLEQQELFEEEIKAFERILVLRILKELGYMSSQAELVQFLSSVWSKDLLTEMIDKKKIALNAINSSIRETQL